MTYDQNPSLKPLRHNLLFLIALRFADSVSSAPPTIVYITHLALATQLATTLSLPRGNLATHFHIPNHQHFAMLKLAAVLHVVGKALDNPERLLFLKMTVMRQAFQIEGKTYSVAVLPHNLSLSHPPKPPVPAMRQMIVASCKGGSIISDTQSAPSVGLCPFYDDSGALVGGTDSDSIVQIPIPPYPFISLRITHPRVMFLRMFLISAVAKGDPVGRRPKKKVSAESDIAQCREYNEGGIDINGEDSLVLLPVLVLGTRLHFQVPLWASHGDVEDIDQRTFKTPRRTCCVNWP
ncbi:hypothetical protein J3A83DRAFT_4379731 [Scleroderma citrinum]